MKFAMRYEPTGVTMKGGGGNVFVCRDPNLDRQVAVKFLREGIDPRHLQDEIRTLQMVRSKNVVQVLDIVSDPHLGIGIVTEYLPGPDLTATSVFPADRAAMLLIIFQLANGVADLHAAGVIHRDIKPNNVKYGPEGVLKVFDFNLSKIGPAAHTLGFHGTYGFAAPEQHGSGVVTITESTDVYSMAATVAFLGLGGKLPPPLMAVPPSRWTGGFAGLKSIDNELAILLDAALSLDPASRPPAASIRDLAGALLLRDSHRATLTVRGVPTVYILDSKNRSAKVEHPTAGGGSVDINYNGLEFIVTSVSGTVLINRLPAKANLRLPNSCVLDLGSPTGRQNERLFVTFDLSHPEVVQ